MLVAAAVCPHPPLLVPEVAGGSAAADEALRAACDQALTAMLATDPDLVVVIGAAPETLAYGSGDSGSLEPYGVDLRIPLGPRVCAGECVLPLSLTIGAFLLQRTDYTGPRQGYGLGQELTRQRCEEIGAELSALDARVALLVMADLSACRSSAAPVAHDPRGELYDTGIAQALADVDHTALLRLDPILAARLGSVGPAALWALAGAVRACEPGPWLGEVHYDAAPYGVGYVVAQWLPMEL